MTRTFLLSAALLFPIVAANAQTPATAPAGTSTTMAPASTPATSAGTAKLSTADQDFITKAAQGGTAEVQMAQLAQQKAEDANVKQFAQQMIDDHTPNNEKLATLASSKGVTAPTSPSAAQEQMMTRLQGLSGEKFDRAYLSGQVKSHQTMLKLFEREATNGHDAELKAFAESTVPTIQKHVTMAQNTK